MRLRLGDGKLMTSLGGGRQGRRKKRGWRGEGGGWRRERGERTSGIRVRKN